MGNVISLQPEFHNVPPDTSLRGVSLEFLKNILDKDEKYKFSNGYSLLQSLTKPETEEKKCSLSELYMGKYGVRGPLIGKIRFFVSHVWSYKFSDLVQAIERFERRSPDRVGSYYFVDYFGINQWKMFDHGELDTLASLIRGSEAVVLVISKLKKPMPITRCWCLYELNVAQASNTTIHVTVPDKERLLLRTHMLLSNDLSELSKFEIDSRNAVATSQADEDKIKKKIKETCGFAYLDMVVRNALKSCVTDLAFSELKNAKCGLLRQHFQVVIPSLVNENTGVWDTYQKQLLEDELAGAIEDQPIQEEEKMKHKKRLKGNKEISCTETCFFSQSLAYIFATCFDFITEGTILNVSWIITEYTGHTTDFKIFKEKWLGICFFADQVPYAPDECCFLKLTSRRTVRCVIVGDPKVGKSRLIEYTQYPYVPNVSQNYISNAILDGKDDISLYLHETTNVRSISDLVCTNPVVFLVCFAVDNQISFDSIKARWYPQMLLYFGRTPFVLVGTKSDLREQGKAEVPIDKAKKLAHDLGASKYLECSASEHTLLEELFHDAILTVLKAEDEENK